MAYEEDQLAIQNASRAESISAHRSPAGGRRISHESKVLLYSLLSGSIAVLTALLFIWLGDYASHIQWTLTLVIVLSWISFAFAARSLVVRPLQTLSNILAALREEDFSIRGRSSRRDDALGEVVSEINELSQTLREQRLGAMEAGALLGKVIAEIDVALFTFDGTQHLRLVNRAGERLLAKPSERLLGHTAEELGLSPLLEGPAARTLDMRFSGATGRWGLRRSIFRQGGAAHQLLVITDLSRALREEERQAWQRLVRVLGHELNNSLAPVRSIAESLEMLLKRDPRPADWEEDVRRGLHIITERSEALTRFMRDYSRLARLPEPQLRPLDLAPLVRRIATLETRLDVKIAGPEVRLEADPDQLEQLLINLIRNAVDASLETRGGVYVNWRHSPEFLELMVQDEGPGITNTSNLFVPFFTTKPGGTGIGLALSRQIAEAHGGTISLRNKKEGRGAEALLRLPRFPGFTLTNGTS
jgi:two-component system nitrogen regulation sensor histidine kinase NtrY